MVDLLPHHIGIFTNFYFQDLGGRKRIFDETDNSDYSPLFVENEKKIFYDILIDPSTKVVVTLTKPDSICLPDRNRGCKTCFEKKRSYPPDMIKRMQEDKNYRKFYNSMEVLNEINTLLYYHPLEPGRTYSPQDFKKIVEDTGGKIRQLLVSSSLLKYGLSPHNLEYKFTGDEEVVAKQFPEVAKFLNSKLRHITNKAIFDSIRNKLSGETIEKLIHEFPAIFSQDSEIIYKSVRNIIKG